MINRKHTRKQIAECFKDSKCENGNLETLEGYNNKYCYIAEINEMKTWDDAQQTCDYRKSNLFKADTEEEEDAIVDFLVSKGLSTENTFEVTFHIGLRNSGGYCSSYTNLCLSNATH